MTPRMFSSTRKCWPSSRFAPTPRRASSEAERLRRVRLDLTLERRRIVAARLRERRQHVYHVRGLVRAPANRLGRKVGAVGLGQQPIRRHLGGSAAKIVRLRICHVACEGNVVAAFERRRQQGGRGEAMEDDRRRGAASARGSRACRPRQPACGRPARARARPRAPPASERPRAGAPAARSRGSSRDRSRRPPSPVGFGEAHGAPRARPGLSRRSDGGGFRVPPLHLPPARRRRGSPGTKGSPTRSSRPAATPASRALASSSSTGSAARVEVGVRVDHS